VIPGQFIVSGAVVSFVFLFGLGAFLLVAATVAVVQRWRQRPHDVGPDALRLLEDLDAHLDQQFSALAGLYERLGPPDLDAGCDRLRQAIRDEKQKGGEVA